MAITEKPQMVTPVNYTADANEFRFGADFGHVSVSSPESSYAI